MPNDLYKKLSDLTVLRRAWHLARNDSRTDFMFDSYRFSDYGTNLEAHLKSLSQSLAAGSYRPKPLLTIDVPKSTLSVRPGSVVEIEDKVVLFAIASLIAPILDKKLPDNVYSWRVKKNAQKGELFHDHEILKFPFLKRQTIQEKIDFVEPWYAEWPRFLHDLSVPYEKEGYKHLVVSDIVAYFENIDLTLLRDHLLRYLPQQTHIINFLIDILEDWAWPAVHGTSAPRGIPQGNGVSSFLGNFYLLSLDDAFGKLSKKRDIKYLRYMDDVKVLAKDKPTAREALFLMNEKLRSLRLNIQGSKTRILVNGEIKEELIDDRLNHVNEIIDKIKDKKSLSTAERANYVDDLKKPLKAVKGKKGVIRDKELRLFRRLITAHALLRNSGMVRLVLDQLDRNPDARLSNSAARYLRVQSRNFKSISDRLVSYLAERESLFSYQSANFMMTLRFMRAIPNKAWKEALYVVERKRLHWYVRQQALLLLELKKISKAETAIIKRVFERDANMEVVRTCARVLSQMPRQDLDKMINSLLFAVDSKLQRLGRYFHGLISDKSKGAEQIKSIFHEYSEEKLLDRFYEVDIIAKADDLKTRTLLLQKLKQIERSICRPLLRSRVADIIKSLSKNVDVVKAKTATVTATQSGQSNLPLCS